MKLKIIDFIVCWWAPILLGCMFAKFTSLMDEKQFRLLFHAMLLLMGATLHQMGKDGKWIAAGCPKKEWWV